MNILEKLDLLVSKKILLELSWGNATIKEKEDFKKKTLKLDSVTAFSVDIRGSQPNAKQPKLKIKKMQSRGILYNNNGA